MRFDHIFGHYAGCSRATAYNHGLDKLDSIKDALEQNRLKGVDYLLQKWIGGNNQTLQIAAMRLICTPEEHRLLNQQYLDATTKLTGTIQVQPADPFEKIRENNGIDGQTETGTVLPDGQKD